MKNWHNFKAYKNMNKKYYLLFALFISVISVFAQKKDENEIKKMTADFEANKTIYIKAYYASKSRRNIIGEKNLENIENLIDNLNTFQDYYYNYIKFDI